MGGGGGGGGRIAFLFINGPAWAESGRAAGGDGG